MEDAEYDVVQIAAACGDNLDDIIANKEQEKEQNNLRIQEIDEEKKRLRKANRRIDREVRALTTAKTIVASG